MINFFYLLLVVLVFIGVGFEFKLIDPQFLKQNTEQFQDFIKSPLSKIGECCSKYSKVIVNPYQILPNTSWENELICDKPITIKPTQMCQGLYTDSHPLKPHPSNPNYINHNKIEGFQNSENKTGFNPLDILNNFQKGGGIFEKKPNMWIYLPSEFSARFWQNFGSRNSFQHLPAIYQICLASIIQRNMQNWNINIIYQEDVKDYIDLGCSLFDYPESQDKCDFIKFSLLNKYGGIWIPYHSLFFHSLDPTIIKNTLYINPNASVVGGEAGNPEFHKLSQMAYQGMLLKRRSSYFTNPYNRYLINNYPVDNSNVDGLVDYNNKKIDPDNLFSQNMTIFKNIKNVKFVILPLKEIVRGHKYNVYLRLSQEQLLESNMWISSLIRSALDQSDRYFSQSTDPKLINTVLIRKSEETKYINGLMDGNEFWNHPNFMTTKSTTRNS
jgi:hypothetical protein